VFYISKKIIVAALSVLVLASCGTTALPPLVEQPKPAPTEPLPTVATAIELKKFCKVYISDLNPKNYEIWKCEGINRLEFYPSYNDAVSISSLLDQGVTIVSRPGANIANFDGKTMTLKVTQAGEEYSAFSIENVSSEVQTTGAGYNPPKGYLVVKATRQHLRSDMTVESNECMSKTWNGLDSSYTRQCQLVNAYATTPTRENAINIAAQFDHGVFGFSIGVDWKLESAPEISVPTIFKEIGYGNNYIPVELPGGRFTVIREVK
jgi:hypothetical protein